MRLLPVAEQLKLAELLDSKYVMHEPSATHPAAPQSLLC
jgi:hypothetical protein